MTSKDILIIDTETTGFSPSAGAELLQVSICDFDGIMVYNEYCRPRTVSSWERATEVNGITPEMVRGKPAPEKLREGIQRIIDDARMLVFHNAPFDMRFLKAIGVSFGNKPVVDTLELAKMTSHGALGNKLEALAEHFNYSYNAHDSSEDVKATAFVYRKLLKLNESAGLEFQLIMNCSPDELPSGRVYRRLKEVASE